MAEAFVDWITLLASWGDAGGNGIPHYAASLCTSNCYTSDKLLILEVCFVAFELLDGCCGVWLLGASLEAKTSPSLTFTRAPNNRTHTPVALRKFRISYLSAFGGIK